MAFSAKEVVLDVGKRFAQSRLNKDFLVKLLRQAAGALSELGQSTSLENALEPLNDSLLQSNVLHNKDKDVRLLVAVCFAEIMRILAPNPPYSDESLKDIFKLLINTFEELSDTTSPYFTRRVRILETVSALKCCVLMLDIGCEYLVLEMFNTFFSVVREDHQSSVYNGMLAIMTNIIDEKVSQPLLDVILRNLLKDKKGVASPSFKLAVSVIENCSGKLEPHVRGFLISSISDRDSTDSELKESYHDIIIEISQCASQMLISVIPSLTQELLTDQVDVRIKAVHLVGKLFALPGRNVTKEYRPLFSEFIKRFSDKSVEVRITAVECAKVIYMHNPTGMEATEVLSALQGRLLDHDDKVRIEAAKVICDLAQANLRHIQPEMIIQTIERLRDKKLSVRKIAMHKLLELYRAYCIKCMDGLLALNSLFEQIPCRVLTLCYDKDCNEFRPQNMELVLAEDLFPTILSVEGRTKHWISFCEHFSAPHTMALNTILSQKRRLQEEMQRYLALRKEEKENGSEEVYPKIVSSFKKLSVLFTVPSKAEENFQKLHQVKDNTIFKALQQLLDECTTFLTSQTIRDKLLKRIGEKHPQFEFLSILSAKCSYNLFTTEHVEFLFIDYLSRRKSGNLETACIDLLLTIVSLFPSLVRGTEKHLLQYLSEEGSQINEKLLQLVAKAGRYMSVELSCLYPYLKKACVEGTRLESKYSVSAFAALVTNSGQITFSDLFEDVLNSLKACKNVPTALQSLGCIAQYALQIYETREEEITEFVIKRLFSAVDSSFDKIYSNDDSICSTSCKLKIYGLKTLVRSFMPYQTTVVRPQINRLLNVLLRLLPEGLTSDGIALSERDSAHVRLAAAKAVLQLARSWDLQISPQVFHLAIMKARDPSSFVRKSLINKIHKLLKQHAIPSRYACAFTVAASDCFTAVQADSIRYLADFIKMYGHEARIHQNIGAKDLYGAMTNYPEYVVVFLIHFLAHDPSFPSANCEDEDVYARFCRPLTVILHALVNLGMMESIKIDVSETVSYMLNIFRAIKKAEDAIDNQCTAKLHILSDIGTVTLNALYPHGKASSHTTRVVLLPSSLYKASSGRKTDMKLSFLNEDSVGRIFVEKVLDIVELPTIRPTSPLTKHAKKSQDDSVQVEATKNCKQTLLRKERTFPLTRKGKGEQENVCLVDNEQINIPQLNMSNRYKRVLEPARNSQELPHKCSPFYKPEKRACNDAESLLGREKSLSCSSDVANQSFSDSQAPFKGADLETSSCENLVRPVSGTPNKLTMDHKQNCPSKNVEDVSKKLVGHQIKLWSPLDKCFYSGTIDEFDSQNSTHMVTYDNGNVERLRLANENWKIIGRSTLEDLIEFDKGDQ